jgi:hypothetical protein
MVMDLVVATTTTTWAPLFHLWSLGRCGYLIIKVKAAAKCYAHNGDLPNLWSSTHRAQAWSSSNVHSIYVHIVGTYSILGEGRGREGVWSTNKPHPLPMCTKFYVYINRGPTQFLGSTNKPLILSQCSPNLCEHNKDLLNFWGAPISLSTSP